MSAAVHKQGDPNCFASQDAECETRASVRVSHAGVEATRRRRGGAIHLTQAVAMTAPAGKNHLPGICCTVGRTFLPSRDPERCRTDSGYDIASSECLESTDRFS